MGDRVEEHRVCIVGADIGKSALVVRFIHNQFVDQDDPTIEDHYQTKVNVDGSPVQLDILDTSGNVEYASFYDKWFRWAEAFICVYSITLQDSFDYITFFREVIKRIKKVDHVPMVLVGTKADSDNKRQVPASSGQNLADIFECPFFECSAKTGSKVNDAFHSIIREIRRLKRKADRERTAIEEQRKKRKSAFMGQRSRSTGPAASRSKSNSKISKGRSTSNAHAKDKDPWHHPLKTGWLQRQGRLGNWKKAYFVLTNDQLVTFDTDKKDKWKEPKGFLNLDDVSGPVGAPKGGSKKKNVFEVPTSERTWALACDKPREMDDWIKAVQGVVLKNKVYGIPIDVVLARSKRSVPVIIEKCVLHLEKGQLTQEGLYRISGDTSEVVGLKGDFDEDDSEANCRDYRDPHVVAGALKLYLRELPDPLLTYALYDAFVASQKNPDASQRVRALKEVVKKLPSGNRETLKFLCAHLRRVANHHKQNKMTVSNLAIVFGPTLMRAPEKEGEGFNPQLLFDMKFQQLTVQAMIEHYEDIFGALPKSASGGGGGGGGGGGSRPSRPSAPPRHKSHSTSRPSGPSSRPPPRSSGASSAIRLPPGWKEYTNKDDGRKYYHNSSTGETSWSFPMPDLPSGWQAMTSPEGKPYFYNTATKKAQWHFPEA